MNRDAVVYVAGHRGLVGSALVRRLQAGGYHRLITRTHAELDLTRQSAVQDFFQRERPEIVFLAAARVGGIHANNTYRAEFIYQNLMIAANVIHAAHEHGVGKLLFLGSSCIYPRDCPQPMKEEYLLTGALEQTNEPYAIAKIAGIKLCASYRHLYGCNFMSVMPTNLYGPGDNYDPENSHVLPALIRRVHEAKLAGLGEVTVWGTGNPRREFLYGDDLADACVFLMERHDAAQIGEFINIGTGEDLTIRDLAQQVCATVGYRGRLVFDPTRPDGTPRKLLDITRMRQLGWRARTPLTEGIAQAYQDYLGRIAT